MDFFPLPFFIFIRLKTVMNKTHYAYLLVVASTISLAAKFVKLNEELKLK